MKKIFCLFFLFAPILVFFSCTQESKKDSNAATPNAASSNTADAHISGPVNWITMDELDAKMKQEPRKVVVDLYTDWCGWCKKMDANTFSDETLAAYLNEKFYAVKFNAETNAPVQFNGETFDPLPGGRRPTNKLTYKLILGDQANGRVGYPTFAFLDEKLQRIEAFPGYKDAAGFDAVAHFVGENHYKGTSFTEFIQNFKSAIPATQPNSPKSPMLPQQGIKIKKQS